MKIVITGAAGFIGSFLSEQLLKLGHDVTGIDNFNDYYSSNIKRLNSISLLKSDTFHLVESDVQNLDTSILKSADYIFHLAGQPGVRSSWGPDFKGYVDNNILVTQRILEAVKHSAALKKFVFASSSSVYGNAQELPLKETARPNPVSPYGVTKLTAENLCSVYSYNYHIPIVSLRFFTVYGPRQRPDMAFHRFFKAHLGQKSITVFGDGSQTRDFTYVADIVNGILSSAFTQSDSIFTLLNLGSGKRIALSEVIDMIGAITEKPLQVNYMPSEKGDMTDTLADITRARELIGYAPSVELRDGLQEEYSWICTNREAL
ncbi:GDP-mannose 4,6-dehydratase [Candidatus Omnitrophota bacterium]